MKKCLSGSLRKGEKLSEAYYFFSVFKLFLIMYYLFPSVWQGISELGLNRRGISNVLSVITHFVSIFFLGIRM